MTDDKVHPKYSCISCEYSTCRKSQYDRHLATRKHANPLTTTDTNSSGKYKCDCGKTYKHRQSLFSHKKDCNEMKKVEENKNLLFSIVKQNEDLKNLILEQNKLINEIVQK